MGLREIESEIISFLNADKSTVLSISGDWGIGKTFFWKKIFDSAKKPEILYSYVSLFGISSLLELKSAIVLNIIENESWVSKLSAPLKRIASVFPDNISQVDVLKPFGRAVVDSCISDISICFDDLERIGNKFDFEDFLGYISYLKENGNCSIVLILSDFNLPDDQQQSWRKYHEKVIDREIRFELLPAECAEIAFSKSGYDKTALVDLVERLGMVNIRVLFKLEYWAIRVTHMLETFGAEVCKSALVSIAVYVHCKYSSSSVIPDIEFLRTVSFTAYHSKIEEMSDNQREWVAYLEKYGWVPGGYVGQNAETKLEKILFDAIDLGYFDEEQFSVYGLELTKAVAYTESQNRISAVWDKYYHGTFKNNRDELVEAFFGITVEEIENVSFNSLKYILSTLRELDAIQEAEEIVTKLESVRSSELLELSKNQRELTREVSDPFLLCRIEKLRISVAPRSMDDLREFLVKEELDRYEQQLLRDLLPEFSSKDFVTLLHSTAEENHVTVVENCLAHGGENALEATRQIASESKLNEMRVRAYQHRHGQILKPKDH